MALVYNQWLGSVTLEDGTQDTSTLQFELRAISYATAVADMVTITAALQAATGAVIRRYTVIEQYVENAFVAPAVTVHVEDKASITVEVDDLTGKKGNLKVPAPLIGVFTTPTGAGANIVDTAAGIVVAYTNLFKSGGQAFISDGEDLSAVVSGKRVFYNRKS